MSGCRYFDQGVCRSCARLDTNPADLLREKEALLSKLTGLHPEASVTGPEWHFRDKIKLTVAGTLSEPLVGLLSEDLARVTELPDCPVQATALNHTLPLLKSFITSQKLTPYDIASRRGELKGLILSWSPTTQQKMVRFVLRSKEALDRVRLGLPLLTNFAVVSVNIQPTPHAQLEGAEEIILSTQAALLHRSNSIELSFSPQSFMQTNSIVASSLYATAVEWLSEWREQKVLDLFCGVGGFALHLAQAGHRVLGVEVNASAIQQARSQALRQNLDAQFEAMPVAQIGQRWRGFSPEIVVVNPPRRGLGPEGLELMLEHLPAVLLYSSCSHESLNIDLNSLLRHYSTARTKIFDMFPKTNHFESLTLLVRR